MLKKGDLFLLVVIIAAVLAGFAYIKFQNTGNGPLIAVIKQDNKIIKEIDLSNVQKPEKIEIYGNYREVILLEKGRIRFEEADCPDKVCVKTGWLSGYGQSAVCLPNRTIIMIEGEDNIVDGSTY